MLNISMQSIFQYF